MARNLTQSQLAELVSVSTATISAFEGGKYTPSMALLYRIATKLDTNIQELLIPLEEGKKVADGVESAVGEEVAETVEIVETVKTAEDQKDAE